MASHSNETHWAVNPQEVVKAVLDAHEFYKEKKIDERYESMALDLVRRYVWKEGVPRESDPFFGAALFVVTRHPWSHPNPLTKTEFAAKLRMKESSLDWYTDSIAEKLGFASLHDRAQLPYYMDPNGTIASVVASVIRSSVGEEVVRSIVSREVTAPEVLADEIVDRLCNVVKVVPSAFRHELYGLVRRKIADETKALRDQLSGK
ncbi:hypothetical protein EU524_00415 [Candidatus Thorarchaeota archaeon]|jgi:hypothetical protein|nr:MAG: hypothetical protein EU524_00415 [Candidatus Thorarchaeota archaeon]